MDAVYDVPSPPESPSETQSLVSEADGERPPDIPRHLRLRPEKPREERLVSFLWPYPLQTLAQADSWLEVIIQHLLEAAWARDFDFAFPYWNSMLQDFLDLGYPIRRCLRADLIPFYYNLCVLPGMDLAVVDMMAEMTILLIKYFKHFDVRDVQLDWQPLYEVLHSELYHKDRAVTVTSIYATFFRLAGHVNRFFRPHTAPDMLEKILPQLDASDLEAALTTQSLLCHFLPISHPQSWIDSIFRLWATFQSHHWTAQWLDFLSRISQKHVDPNASDPRLLYIFERLQPGENFEDRGPEAMAAFENAEAWKGIRRDVGIFTARQWSFIMTHLLRVFGVPVGSPSTQSSAGHGARVADAQVSSRVVAMLKTSDAIESFANLIVYSMSEDGDSSSPRCQALESASQTVTAMETFFHPSNHGRWSAKLAKFLSYLAWRFVVRWSQEAKAECATPPEWRLTARIRTRFVSMLSGPILMSMFSKDYTTSSAAQHALRLAAHLQPSLMIPPIIERSLLALEGLLETHRTTTCITALTAVMGSMLDRQSYPAGATALPTILDLLLPGIDPNDPSKTMLSSILIARILSRIKLSDVTISSNAQGLLQLQPPPADLDLTQPSNSLESFDGMVVMEASSFLTDWALTYFKRVMSFFENLPEPQGKQEKTGGKLEESTITGLCNSFDELCKALSPKYYPPMLDYYKTYVCENVNYNMVKTVGLIAGSLSKGFADPIVFRTIYPLCDAKIRVELEAGASSIPTMSTGPSRGSDLKLHWFLSILVGASTRIGAAVLEFEDQILSLLRVMLQGCKSKRSYVMVSRFQFALFRSALEIYPRDTRFLNPDEWNSHDNRHADQVLWGKTYKITDVRIDWHVPSSEEIDFVLKILDQIVEPFLKDLASMLGQTALDHDRKCDFVKDCTLVKAALCGVSAFAVRSSIREPGDPTSDWGESVEEFLPYTAQVGVGIPLAPPDPRYERIIKFKADLVEISHQFVGRLQLFNDNIDCVKAIIAIVSSLLIEPAWEVAPYESAKQGFRAYQDLNKISKLYKVYPRFVWIRYAQLLHFTRLQLPRCPIQRSLDDDKMIKALLEFSLSTWVSIRRLTQKTLFSVVETYDGARGLLLPALLDSLKPGTEPDRMKGAIYVLGSKTFLNFCIEDLRYCRPYLLTFLQCQHSEKTSIQSLVYSLLHRQMYTLREVEASRNCFESPRLEDAISQLNCKLLQRRLRHAQVESLRERRCVRMEKHISEHCLLASELLVISSASITHWKYSLNASRLLTQVIRCDKPPDVRLVSHFMVQLYGSELPSKRSQALDTLSRILYLVKMRTMSRSPDDLLLRRSRNPLRADHPLKFPSPTQVDDFRRFLSLLQAPLLEQSTLLVDKFSTGWLICNEEKAYRVPTEEDVIVWDPSSAGAIEACRAFMSQESFWMKLAINFSQEKSNNVLVLSHVTALKSIFQIFREEFWSACRPALEKLLENPADRDRQRAAAEFISGMLRATKHWPLARQRIVWDWFQLRLKTIYDSIRPEGLACWLMCFEYILRGRDPRRNQPLIDFIFNLDTDDYSSAFESSKAHHVVGIAIKCLSWPALEPHIEKYSDFYWSAIDTDYLEVRGCVSLNLRCLTEQQTHLSFPDVQSFLRASQHPSNEDKPLIADRKLLNAAIESLLIRLRQSRSARLPAQHGNQEYDKCAMTILMWLWSSLTDFQATAVYPFVPRIFPELFYMHEMVDNQELCRLSHAVMLSLSWMPWPREIVDSTLSTLLLLTQVSSWKVRLDALETLRVFFFHQLFTLGRPQVEEILESLCVLLEDSSVEVRGAAALTLSGIIHCSERAAILKLKTRFTQTLQQTPVPRHRFINGVEEPGYQAKIIRIHGAVLGSSALINAFPYDVPAWVPEVLIRNLCSHTTSPAIISTTAKRTLTTFKKTHQDTWVEGQKMFCAEDLATLNDCLIGSSYYA